MLQLFGYWRSSASFRVRLVLQLKGLDYEQHPVNLRQGEQKEKAYRRVNPQGLVPFLIDGDVQFGQSVAIMEYLDETYPAYPLMPSAPIERARVRRYTHEDHQIDYPGDLFFQFVGSLSDKVLTWGKDN